MKTDELAARIVAVMSDGYDDKEEEEQGFEYIKQALDDMLEAHGEYSDGSHEDVLEIIENLTTLLEDFCD